MKITKNQMSRIKAIEFSVLEPLNLHTATIKMILGADIARSSLDRNMALKKAVSMVPDVKMIWPEPRTGENINNLFEEVMKDSICGFRFQNPVLSGLINTGLSPSDKKDLPDVELGPVVGFSTHGVGDKIEAPKNRVKCIIKDDVNEDASLSLVEDPNTEQARIHAHSTELFGEEHMLLYGQSITPHAGLQNRIVDGDTWQHLTGSATMVPKRANNLYFVNNESYLITHEGDPFNTSIPIDKYWIKFIEGLELDKFPELNRTTKWFFKPGMHDDVCVKLCCWLGLATRIGWDPKLETNVFKFSPELLNLFRGLTRHRAEQCKN